MENYDQTVLLQQELDYLEDYVGLLNMRYKCQTKLHFEIEEPLKNMYIPKLSLQPIIENSVFHGILPKKAVEGHITVKVFTHPELSLVVMEIIDDGIGLDDSQLEKLRAHLQQEQLGENIGLKNVWLRMRLLFGKETQTELTASAASGMQVRFLFPQDTIRIMEVQHE